MKRIDYLVVGLGIAGISLCETLRKHGRSFMAVDNGEPGATAGSGGVLNPTVLKRFTAAWGADTFFPVAVQFYHKLSQELQLQFVSQSSIFRIFKSVEEQNNWSVASDKRNLRQFLSSQFFRNENPAIHAPYGFGKVVGSAHIRTAALIAAYRNHLLMNEALLAEKFNYDKLQPSEGEVIYKDLIAKKIIFAEGAKAVENPFFPKHTLIGNKGEYLIIEAPELKLETLLKGPVYVIPLGNDLYKVGATYSRDDYSLIPTDTARLEILSKLESFIRCPFKVIGQTAGVRPTTKDHRPLLGSMPTNSHLVFFNGLGSRGFLMAPLLSEILYNYMEDGAPMPSDMDIMRMDNSHR